ncbi:MAG: hypothetical protein COA42_05140 [Alteromonadaceae bacterium]|nr:MAG: hypothetical protein COA42_05140 [Alteromonadaceae bacterium]
MAEQATDNAHKIVSLIYETAEDVELWPTLLDACKTELQQGGDANHRERPPSSEDENILASHLLRALRINQRIEKMQNEIGAAKNVLDCLPMAIMTVDAQCSIVSANKLAHKVVSSSSLLKIENGTIYATRENAGLKRIVVATLGGMNTSKENSSAIKLADVQANSYLSIFAVKTTDSSDPFGRECCTLFIVSNVLSDFVSPDVLRRVYKLSPAESRLAHKLVSGDSLSEIAVKLGVTHNTARNQLKAVFSKTGTNRQSELVGLILSTPNSGDNKPFAPDAPAKNLEQQSDLKLKKMTLDDGREMAYFEFGDPSGVPVIYFHEFIVWQWWKLIDQEQFNALKVRVIAPLRPGFFGSKWKSTISLPDWSQDFLQFVDHLKLESYYLLGFSAGGPFAASAAHVSGERCLGLSLVSTIVPVENLSELEHIQPNMSRLVLGFAKYTPRVYRSFIKAILKTAGVNTGAYLREYLRHWSDYDQGLSEDAIVAKSLADSFLCTISADSSGIINEPIIATRPWGFDIDSLPQGTQIWRGAEDKAIPIKLAEKLNCIPGCVEHIVPNMGHLLIYDCWKNILETLLESPVTEPVRKR